MTKKEYYFREWIELEGKKEQVIRAVEEVREDFPELIIDFLSTALSLNKEKLQDLGWAEIINQFSQICNDLVPKKIFPILSRPSIKDNQNKEIWDYEGRTWYFYSHILAKSYGWNLEYLSKLSVEDALAHIQEILTNEQLDREFTWSMSEASVIYDPKTKLTRPNPLPRPYWMKEKSIKSDKDVPIAKFKIAKSYMPMGAVDYSAISDEFRPKEIEHK